MLRPNAATADGMRDSPYRVELGPGFTARFVVGTDQPEATDNVDAEIAMADGTRYAATFLTSSPIAEVLQRRARTGQAGHRSYFWRPDLVILPEAGTRSMVAAIGELVRSSEIESACTASTQKAPTANRIDRPTSCMSRAPATRNATEPPVARPAARAVG